MRSSDANEGFLISGLTRAVLNEVGKLPSAREKLTSLVIIGPSSSKHCLSNRVGMESSWHCLLDDEKMSWRTSERVVGMKQKF